MDPSLYPSRAPDSFRREFTERVPGFRTPPPPLSSIEPLSPVLHPARPTDQSFQVRKRRRHEEPIDYKTRWQRVSNAPLADSIKSNSHIAIDSHSKPPHPYAATYYRSQLSPTALDVFAAVATSPDLSQEGFGPREGAAHSSWPQQQATSFAARGSKRSHSEAIDWRPQQQNSTRPSTSYATGSISSHDQSCGVSSAETSSRAISTHGKGAVDSGKSTMMGDSRLEDAELLLGFARAGGYAVPHTPKYLSQSMVKVEDRRMDLALWQTQHNGNSYVDAQPFTRSTETHGWNEASLSAHHIPHTADNHKFLSNGDKPIMNSLVGDQAEPGVNNGAPNSWTELAPTQEPAKKPRVHKGWPKGKPRGKRSDATKTAQTKKSTKRATKSEKPNQSQRSQKGQPSMASRLLALEDYTLPQRPKSADGHSKVGPTMAVNQIASTDRAASVPADVLMNGPSKKAPRTSAKNEAKISICGLCQNMNSPNGYHELWITCNGCKEWYHTVCVGFKTEREVRDVDKFYCSSCEPKHGKTTFVRKSSRAHVSVDYAGLNEGQLRTATDTVEHHFIQPIKDRTFEFLPEKFPRMPPELVTAEFFEKSGTMSEPVLIPATLNPQPGNPGTELDHSVDRTEPEDLSQELRDLSDEYEYDCVPDDGQDKLDMVMPKDLTVRRVAELLGTTRPLQVIDVKSQDQGDTTWNLGKWADYYEAPGEKPVRNVISLEVSRTKLSRLIRRPKIVRDLDLQDQVWPREELENGKYPQVQFYCLMSVADCYTDFHIDFGGSSVYYHILRGKKTFFFIPPKKQHLKKYEEWCISPNQESVFLGNLTKECYRVDLSEGDTMLIPSGWIHAVWTPENSLVIGGNFLTRMHYGMQIQVNEIEKSTGVGRMFRYPSFQKVLWYTVIQYLQNDPVPYSVAQALYDGNKFERHLPVFLDFDNGEDEQSEYYNARHYSEGEIDGLGDLLGYIFRTVMISLGLIPLPKTKRDAVTRSLPKGYGDHLALLKTFALWVGWKRGNEELPIWAHPDAPLSELETTMAEKKSAPVAAKKSEKNDREVIPERRSQRQPPKTKDTETNTQALTSLAENDQSGTADAGTQATSRVWCEACRRSRVRCKHRELGDQPVITEGFGIRPQTLPSTTSQTPTARDSVPAEESTTEIVSGQGITVAESYAPAVGDVDIGSGSQTPAPSSINRNSSPNVTQVRIKACEECRKSKRRCIHDADGNVDPVKAKQNPVPRAFSATKRARHDRVSNDLPPPKRSKASPGDVERDQDLENDEAGHHILGRSGSDAVLAGQDTMVPLEVEPSSSASLPAHLINSAQGSSSSIVPDLPDWSTHSIASHKHQAALDDGDDEARLLPVEGHIATVLSNGSNDGTDTLINNEGSKLDKTDSITGNESRANRSGSENRSRTPSLHVQTNSTESLERSRSPPTSPLTEVDRSSPVRPKQEDHTDDVSQMHLAPQGQLAIPKDPVRTNHAQKAEYGSPQTPNGNSERQTSRSASRSSKKSAAKRSNASRSVSADGTVTIQAGNIVRATSAKSQALSPTEGVIEDESMRLARQLQEQEFGLRQRSK